MNGAVSLLDDTERMLESESSALDDLELSEEAANVAKLRQNMQSRAPSEGTDTGEDGDGGMMSFGCAVNGVGGTRTTGWVMPAFALVAAIGAARRRRERIRHGSLASLFGIRGRRKR